MVAPLGIDRYIEELTDSSRLSRLRLRPGLSSKYRSFNADFLDKPISTVWSRD